MKLKKGKTVPLFFDWRASVKNKPILLKARTKISGWDNAWTKGYISSIGNRQSINGGKLSIYNSIAINNSGYMVLNGYDELLDFFEVKF